MSEIAAPYIAPQVGTPVPKRAVQHIGRLHQKYFQRAYKGLKSKGLKPLIKLRDRNDDPVTQKASLGGEQRLHKYLDAASKRASILYPNESDEFKGFFASVKENMADEEYCKQRAEFLEVARSDSRDGDEARHQLAKIRLTTSENFIRASSNYISFFDIVELKEDEQPYLQSTVPQEVNVECIGDEGPPRVVGPMKRQSQNPVDLCIISTDRFEYPLMDPYQGYTLKNDALALIDLEFDLTIQVDILLKQFILAGTPGTRLKTTFNTTGPEQERDYYTSQHINDANLPTGNFVDAPGIDSDTFLNQACLTEIVRYTDSWGTGAFRDGSLAPVAIHVPSGHSHGWLTQVNIIANHTNSKVEEIFEGGAILSWGGKNWIIIGDNTLDPDAGVAYVRLNKSIGTYFHKPTLERHTTRTFEERNKEYQWQSKVFGAGFTSDRTPNLFAIRYRN